MRAASGALHNGYAHSSFVQRIKYAQHPHFDLAQASTVYQAADNHFVPYQKISGTHAILKDDCLQPQVVFYKVAEVNTVRHAFFKQSIALILDNFQSMRLKQEFQLKTTVEYFATNPKI